MDQSLKNKGFKAFPTFPAVILWSERPLANVSSATGHLCESKGDQTGYLTWGLLHRIIVGPDECCSFGRRDKTWPILVVCFKMFVK